MKMSWKRRENDMKDDKNDDDDNDLRYEETEDRENMRSSEYF